MRAASAARLHVGRVTAVRGVRAARGGRQSVSLEVRAPTFDGGLAHLTLLFPKRAAGVGELHDVLGLCPGAVVVLVNPTLLGRFGAAFGQRVGLPVPCYRASPEQHATDGSFAAVFCAETVAAVDLAADVDELLLPRPDAVFPRLAASCCAIWLYRSFGHALPDGHGAYTACSLQLPSPVGLRRFLRLMADAVRACRVMAAAAMRDAAEHVLGAAGGVRVAAVAVVGVDARVHAAAAGRGADVGPPDDEARVAAAVRGAGAVAGARRKRQRPAAGSGSGAGARACPGQGDGGGVHAGDPQLDVGDADADRARKRSAPAPIERRHAGPDSFNLVDLTGEECD